MNKMASTIILLAISLSIDALGVGIVYGLRKIKIPLFPKLTICIFSIIYSGIALTLGKTLSNILPPHVSKLIGVTILSLMGIWIILQSLLKKENDGLHNCNTGNKNDPLLKIVIKSLGITIQVIRNPEGMDMDKSGIIDIRESLLLGFALSVDAIGVGIGSALAGFHSMIIPPAVGLFQLVFLYTGLYLGKKVTLFEKANKKFISVLPGILLLSLAFLRIC
jgi:putative sporulation protein YtaF